MKSNCPVLVLLSVCAPWIRAGEEPNSGTADMLRAIQQDRYKSVVELYEKGQPGTERDGRARYLAGFAGLWAYLEVLSEFEEAK